MSDYERGRLAGLEEAREVVYRLKGAGVTAMLAGIRSLASRPAQPERPALAFPEEFANKVSAIYKATAQPAPGTARRPVVGDTVEVMLAAWYLVEVEEVRGDGFHWNRLAPTVGDVPMHRQRGYTPWDGNWRWEAGTGEPERTAAQERAAVVAFLAEKCGTWIATAIERGDHISDQAQRSGGDR